MEKREPRSQNHFFKTTYQLYLVGYRYRWVFVLVMFLSMAAVSVHHLLFPVYRAKSRLYIQTPRNSSLFQTTAKFMESAWMAGDREDYPLRYLKLLSSQAFETFLQREIRHDPEVFAVLMHYYAHPPPLPPSLSQQAQMYDALADIALTFMDCRRADQDMIDVYVRMSNRNDTAVIGRFMAVAVDNFIIQYESKELADAENYLRAEVDNIQGEIDNIGLHLGSIGDRQDGTVLNGVNLVQQRLNRLLEEREQVQIKIDEREQMLAKLAPRLPSDEGRDPNPAEASLDTLRGGVAELARTYREDLGLLNTRNNALKKLIDEVSKKVKPQNELRTYDYRRKLDVDHAIFQDLKKNLFEIKMMSISMANRVRLFELASRDTTIKEAGLPQKLMIAAILSFCLFALFFVMYEALFPTVQSADGLRDLGFRVLATIPDIARTRGPWEKLSLFKRKKSFPFVNFGSSSRWVDSFRVLRTRVMRELSKNGETSSKVICVVSPRMGEGKSVVAANLALALAYQNHRTLVVDADFHHGTLSRLFKIHDKPGLRELLSGSDDVQTSVTVGNGTVLEIIGAGISKRLDIAAPAWRRVLNTFREQYDYIIVDTSAFFESNEPAICVEGSDLVLVTTRFQKTQASDAVELLDLLDSEMGLNTAGLLNCEVTWAHSLFGQSSGSRAGNELRSVSNAS